MCGVTGAVIGGAVIGGVATAYAGKKSASAQGRAADASISEQQRQFDIAHEAQAPYRQVGSAALNQLAALYGLPQYQAGVEQPLSYEDWTAQNGGAIGIGAGPDIGPAGAFGISRTGQFTGNLGNELRSRGQYQQYLEGFQPAAPQGAAPNFENFFASPDYQFALRQGQQTAQNSAAAGGGLYSGNTLRALTDYGQGMASQHLGTYANRLAGIAGVGQTAATNVGNAALQTGTNVGNLLMSQGDARASGLINQGNAWANTANQIGMYYGMGGFRGGGGNAMAYNWSGPQYAGYA